jgi:hypothetical protein
MSRPNLSQLPFVGAVTLVYNPDQPKFLDHTKLDVQRTAGGGDCLYHALAHLANHYRHPNAYKFYHRGLVDIRLFRNAVANIIERDWDSFRATHPELQTIDRDKFLNDVRSNRWAGEPELDAAIRLFPDVRVAVWTRNASNDTILHSLVTPDDGTFKKTWHILMRANHYEWMSQRLQTMKNQARLRAASMNTASSSSTTTPPADAVVAPIATPTTTQKTAQTTARTTATPTRAATPNPLLRELAEAREAREAKRALPY